VCVCVCVCVCFLVVFWHLCPPLCQHSLNFLSMCGCTDIDVSQAELRSMWDKYYKECQACVFVVDAEDEDKWDLAQSALGTPCFLSLSLSLFLSLSLYVSLTPHHPYSIPSVHLIHIPNIFPNIHTYQPLCGVMPAWQMRYF
jgi:hypothetical protein